MKIQKKEQNLILILIGILFLIVAWLLIASPVKDKTETIKTENVDLKAKAELYQSVMLDLDTYENGIKECEAKKQEIIAKYPVSITREDEIMFWANMENAFPQSLALTSLNLSEWEPMVPETQPAETAPAEMTTEETGTDAEATANVDATAQADAASEETQQQEAQGIYLFKAPINYGFQSTYDGLKDMLTYVLQDGNHKSIQNVSVSFDATTGNLMGTVDLDLYFLVGVDKQYQALQIPFVQKGVLDVFHTVGDELAKPSDTSNEEAENTDTTEDNEE